MRRRACAKSIFMPTFTATLRLSVETMLGRRRAGPVAEFRRRSRAGRFGARDTAALTADSNAGSTVGRVRAREYQRER